MEVLRRERHVLSLTEATRAVGNGGLPDGAAVITFDDGYADNLTGLPALEQHEIPATVFVSTGHLGRTHGFWWDELERLAFDSPDLPDECHLSVRGVTFDLRLPGVSGPGTELASGWRALQEQTPSARQLLYEGLWNWMQGLLDAEREQALIDIAAWAGVERTVAHEDRTLTRDEAGRMAEHPLLDLGTHTVTHPRLSALAPALQRLEIGHSRAALEAVIGRPVIAMAYPFGGPSDISSHSARMAAQAGYRAAFMAVPHVAGHERDPFRVPRHYVADMDGEAFASWLREPFDGAPAP
jgi:peptidoglycan/xylan/chitin deacetylase (PgdA/CDA1 family)